MFTKVKLSKSRMQDKKNRFPLDWGLNPRCTNGGSKRGKKMKKNIAPTKRLFENWYLNQSKLLQRNVWLQGYSSVKHAHTHTHPSRTTRVSRYQKGKTNLDFTEARDSEWHWYQLLTLLSSYRKTWEKVSIIKQKTEFQNLELTIMK